MQNAEFRRVTVLDSTDRWVLEHRGRSAPLDPSAPTRRIWEEEPDGRGALAPTAVVFLTNRECPFRCVMCDLWVNTLDETVPPGAIAAQIRTRARDLPPARQIKLYNAGSFFDPRAIPPDDDEEIARRGGGFERVIVEAHPGVPRGRVCGAVPALPRLDLGGTLEVAIGLETAHPDVLARLNKRMTLDAFRRAADSCASTASRCACSSCSARRSCRRTTRSSGRCRSLDVAARLRRGCLRGDSDARRQRRDGSARRRVHAAAAAGARGGRRVRALARRRCACLPISGTSSGSSTAAVRPRRTRAWSQAVALSMNSRRSVRSAGPADVRCWSSGAECTIA